MKARLFGATMLAGLSAATSMAYAQPVQRGDAAVIEELVVTARRRAESVVEVPATATFMGGEELQARAVEDSRDLARTVPGLTVSNTGGQSNMNIVVRGQGGATAFRGNADGAVGLYEDGLYVGSSSFTRLSFFDLQRSEVLRGPQSAYYSRNALGGAINLVHQRPDLGEQSGSLTVGYGENATWTADAIANMPVNDQLAVRVGATYLDKNQGFFRNTVDPRTGVLGDRYLDHEDYWGGRLQALWKPSDNFSALLRAEYFDEESPGLGTFSYDLLTSPDDPYTPMVDTRDRFLRKTTALSAELQWNIGEGVLTSRTSGKWARQELFFDRDALFGIPFNTSAAAGREFWVGFRDTDIDAYQQSLDYTQPIQLFGLSGDFAGGVEVLSGKTDRFSYEGTICALVPTPAVCPRANPANANNIAEYHVKSWSYSGFASLNLALTERLEVTVEGRLIHDKADFDGAQEFGSNAVRVYDQFVNPAVRSDSLKSTNFSPAVSAKFAVTDSSNVFGRIATGYRAGGFNDRTGNTLSPTRTDLLPGVFDPETNISYELGFKGEYSGVPLLQSVFLDIAAYYIESDDVIIDSTATVVNPSDSIINNKNGGTSEQYGVELQIRTRTHLGENTQLITYTGLNYAEGFYTDPDARANPTINAATGTVTLPGTAIFGNRIPLLPKWQASASIGLEHTIGEQVLFGTLGFTGEWQQAHDQGQTQPFTKRLADRALFDLTAGIRNERYTVRAVVKNLFDNQFWLAPAVAAQGRTARTNLPTDWRFEVTRRF